MKLCGNCGEIKSLENFYKRKDSADGFRKTCKKCESLRVIAWQKSNPEKFSANRNRLDKKKIANKQKRYYLSHKDQESTRKRKYRTLNKHKICEIVARRRSAKLKATPKWANQFIISEAYALAALRTDVFGFKWHVDHIVPLKNKIVCGLHVEYNMQVIPMSDNLRKGNSHCPDMP